MRRKRTFYWWHIMDVGCLTVSAPLTYLTPLACRIKPGLHFRECVSRTAQTDGCQLQMFKVDVNYLKSAETSRQCLASRSEVLNVQNLWHENFAVPDVSTRCALVWTGMNKYEQAWTCQTVKLWLRSDRYGCTITWQCLSIFCLVFYIIWRFLTFLSHNIDFWAGIELWAFITLFEASIYIYYIKALLSSILWELLWFSYFANSIGFCTYTIKRTWLYSSPPQVYIPFQWTLTAAWLRIRNMEAIRMGFMTSALIQVCASGAWGCLQIITNNISLFVSYTSS